MYYMENINLFLCFLKARHTVRAYRNTIKPILLGIYTFSSYYFHSHI